MKYLQDKLNFYFTDSMLGEFRIIITNIGSYTLISIKFIKGKFEIVSFIKKQDIIILITVLVCYHIRTSFYNKDFFKLIEPSQQFLNK